MINELRVQTSDLAVSDGAITQARGGKTGELMVQAAHAKYQDAVRRGNCYTATTQGITALSLGVTATTGLILENPAGSGKNFVILEALVALASQPGTTFIATLGLWGIVTPTHTTPTAMTFGTGFNNALLGGGSGSVALLYSALTTGAPLCLRAIGGGPLAASSLVSPFIKDDIAGALTIAPGTAISFGCKGMAVSVIGTLTWEEVPA